MHRQRRKVCQSWRGFAVFWQFVDCRRRSRWRMSRESWSHSNNNWWRPRHTRLTYNDSDYSRTSRFSRDISRTWSSSCSRYPIHLTDVDTYHLLSSRNSDGVTTCWGAKYTWGIKIARFSTNKSLYLANDTRLSPWLLWKANRKPHPSFWMASVSMTLRDL